MNHARRGCGSGFCVCACVSVFLHVCVQAPLESINPKSNRRNAEASCAVCWISLWNIGCCFHNTHFPSSRQEHPLWCLDCPPRQVAAEFVYHSGVFSAVLWSVILHLWALLIPFLSCVSPLIFDPNLKPPHRIELFFSPPNSTHEFVRERERVSCGAPAFGLSFSHAHQWCLLLYISI